MRFPVLEESRKQPVTAVHLVSLVVFASLIAVTEYAVRVEASRDEAQLTSRALAEASIVRASLEAELNSTSYLGVGLAGYLSLNPDLDDATANRLLASVYRYGRNVRNIGLAPDNRLEFVYPLAGNEAALGVRYEDLPGQWPGVERAMRLRETVVVGPLALVQGGFGIISRTPVFLENGAYWGIVSMVIDVDTLLATAAETTRGSVDAEWAIAATAEEPGNDRFIYGDPELFEGGAVIQSVTLPGGSWDLAVAPRATADVWRIGVIRVLGYLFALVIAILVYLAVSERIQIQHMALHDDLTGLPNRRLLVERVEQQIALASRYGKSFCLLYLDLDGFKAINDRHGHHAGDAVLVELSRRFRAVLRDSDTVARMGGDEFIVLLRDTEQIEGARRAALNLQRELRPPIPWRDHKLMAGASIGIGRYPDHGESASALIRAADKGMYAAKQVEKGSILVIDA